MSSIDLFALYQATKSPVDSPLDHIPMWKLWEERLAKWEPHYQDLPKHTPIVNELLENIIRQLELEEEMAIPCLVENEVAIPPITEEEDEFHLENLFQTTLSEEEMAIPFPCVEKDEFDIESEIQALLDEDWKDDANGEIETKALRLEELLKKLEDSILSDSTHENPSSVILKSKEAHTPPHRQTGEVINFFIFNFPVCDNLVSLGLKSVLYNMLGLRNWKTTKKKFYTKNGFYLFLVVVSTLPLIKSKNKFGKGDFDVPFDNG